MSIRKVKIKNGETKWEVRAHENGRGSKRITRRFDRKVDAEDFLDSMRQTKKDAKENPFLTATFSGRTFGTEAQYWLSVKENIFSASHLVRAKGVLKEVLPHWKDFALEKFTADLLSQYQKSELNKGLSNAGVNRKTEVICAIIENSYKHVRIPVNPTRGFTKLPVDSEEASFWSLHEARSFLKVMDQVYPKNTLKRQNYIVYLVALNTALRAGEIWGLKKQDIVSEHGMIKIQRQYNRVTLDFTVTKGKTNRAVPCPSNVLEELQDWIRFAKIKDDETIFINGNRNPVCHDHFATREFEKDIRTWGGRRIRFHDLRHTASTLLAAAKVDVRTIKDVCGHKQIETTMRYVHLVSGAIQNLAADYSVAPIEVTNDHKKAHAG